MPSKESAPGKQERRFASYLDSLARAAGHADRAEPLKAYCRGLLLPLERKSVEPIAARLAPHDVRQMHQSLHHLVAASPWEDDAVLTAARRHALTAMTAKTPVAAWVVDDTGFPKKGKHSVGVARQYCGQVGKQENCQVAVSLSVATQEASLPVAWRLYLPEAWAGDSERRRKAGVPDEVRFQTKQTIALEQIRKALSAGIAAEWCWPTPLTATTAASARSWRRSDWSMRWACKARRRCGERARDRRRLDSTRGWPDRPSCCGGLASSSR